MSRSFSMITQLPDCFPRVSGDEPMKHTAIVAA